jgi:hypothetical protein
MFQAGNQVLRHNWNSKSGASLNRCRTHLLPVGNHESAQARAQVSDILATEHVAIHTVTNEVGGSAPVRGDDRGSCGQRFIDDQCPPVPPRGHYQQIGLGKAPVHSRRGVDAFQYHPLANPISLQARYDLVALWASANQAQPKIGSFCEQGSDCLQQDVDALTVY